MLANTRRGFFAASGSIASTSLLSTPWLPQVFADDMSLPAGSVQFAPQIEPLVQLLENSSQDQVIDKVLMKIRSGTSYRELLTALFLAGIRNVQPRPAVGFKFHSVLVVHAAHQASVAALDSQRWMPLLWGIDYFKKAQATDVTEGDWTMAAVDESKLPSGSKALSDWSNAMEQWDVEAADVAAASASRILSSNQLLDVLAKYASRDFRSIGHKSIYVAGAFRLLGLIGWEHSEPVIRSLVYAALNHTGESNPASRDAEADRAGRRNWEHVKSLKEMLTSGRWKNGNIDSQATIRLLEALRSATPNDASQAVITMLQDGVHPKSLYDGMFLMAAELVSQQPAIVPLHAVTTTNALHYLYQSVSNDELRLWLMLQSASFLAHFREAANLRGEMSSHKIDLLTSNTNSEATTEDVFRLIRNDGDQASTMTMNYLTNGGSVEEIIRRSRELVFLKGNDSHDYKFSSAMLEDFYHIDPRWRNQYLASCTYLLRGDHENTTSLAKKILGLN